MKDIHKTVIQMRRNGSTYKEIMKTTKLAMGSVSYICNKYLSAENDSYYRNNLSLAAYRLNESRAAKVRAYHVRNKTKHKEDWIAVLRNIDRTFLSYICGLYAGEGTKGGTEFQFTNSNPKLIIQMVKFLDAIDIEWTAALNIHTTMDRDACQAFWTQFIQIDFVTQTDTRKRKRKLSSREYYGVIQLRAKGPLGLREAVAEATGYPL